MNRRRHTTRRLTTGELGRRKTRPTLECLEDRQLLSAVNGGSWVFPSRITYSFVPDGTSLGGVASNLYSTLNAITPTASWQQAIEKAAVIWSSYANINLALVSDNGAGLGINGNQQDDPRFGDIRIGMIPQSPGTLAVAFLPPPYNGGTAAGDIVFNSKAMWQINSNYDVETVALHEFGHALGLDHSAISSAVMYAYYNGVKQSVTTDDIGGIQSVYGAYPTDTVNNGSIYTAQNLNGLIDGNGQIALGSQSLAGNRDNDFYTVTVPATTTGSMTVQMQSTNLSSVSPRLILYDGSMYPFASASMPNNFGATASYTVSGVTPGQVFYIRALAASGYGSFGAFGIEVNFGSSPQAPIAPPNTVVPQQPDQGGGGSALSNGPGGWNGFDTSKPRPSDSRHWNQYQPQIIHLGTLTGWGGLDVLPGNLPPDSFNRFDPNGASIAAAPVTVFSTGAFGRSSTDPMAAMALAPWAGTPATNNAFDAALAQWGDDAASMFATDAFWPQGRNRKTN